MIEASRLRLRLLPASHPHRPDLLHILALSLAARSQSLSSPAEFEEAIEILHKLLSTTPQHHPSYPLFIFDLAELFRGRFQEDRETRFHDLEKSIALHRDALKLRPAPHPKRGLSLIKLELVFTAFFDLKGAPPDFKEYIMVSREALDLLPPYHPSYCPIMSNLATVLFARFQKENTKEDLEESVVLYYKVFGMKNNPDRSATLYNLANVLSARYNEDYQLRDLEESIVLYQKALVLLPAFHPDRGKSLLYLGRALSDRFLVSGDCQDLDKAISMFQAILDSRISPNPSCHCSLNTLENALPGCFDGKGELNDPEGCITLGCEALKLRPPLLPDIFSTLNALGNALVSRFEQRGDFQDLQESILLHREALALQRTHRLPVNRLSLCGLGCSLRVRYIHRGNVQDLEESISLHREELDLTSISEPYYALVLGNLAIGILARCNRSRTFHELDEIILLCRAALEAPPASRFYRSVMIGHLAAVLFTRFEQNKIPDDIDEVILLQREALRLRPQPHPSRNASLVNLANGLTARFRHTGCLSDLEEGIMLHKEALSSLPDNHSDYLWSLRDFASALADGFDATARAEDLDEAVVLYKRTISLGHVSHPTHVFSLLNLGKALRQRFEYSGSSEDIEGALRYLEEASRCQSGLISSRFEASVVWADCAEKHRRDSALNAYSYAITLLPLLASSDLTLGQRYDVLRYPMLVGSAAKSAIDANRYTDAVVFLSTGRSVFWSQALQLRTSVEELADSHPALAEDYTSVSKLLEQASYSKYHSILDSSSPRRVDAATHTNPSTLTDRRDHIIEEIRRIPGFDRFLLPLAFSSLRAAADRGPVVLLNASQLGCDALILRKTGSVDLVPLRDIDMRWVNISAVYFDMLLDAAAVAAKIPQEETQSLHEVPGSGKTKSQSSTTALNYLWEWESALKPSLRRPEMERAEPLVGRDMTRSSMTDFQFLEVNEGIFRFTLWCLWLGVVKPVVNALGLKKMNELPRIWWCPTGLFTSLPLHAAGFYSKDSKPIDCVFEYAISSYCTSPQDLLHSSPPINLGFKMTTIIEPNAPGLQPLPATREELQIIGKHIQQHLVTHIGSRETPTRIDNVLSDIQQSSFVHFGCHGKQDPDRPLESYLHLSGGKLTMSRIMKECRVPEGALAYLSACETAKMDEARPDESLNLVATMLFAGFRSVVGTMQSIFDEDAPVVAEVFYGHLFRNGKEAPPDVRDAALGLHLATKELRDRGKPFHGWVPYVHYGI